MDIGFDPFALFVAVLALYCTLRESRKSNVAICRVIHCQYAGSWNIADSKPKSTFKVLIRNDGISLYDLKVGIRIVNYGVCNIPLHIQNAQNYPNAEFARGMIAEFGLDTTQIDQAGRAMLDLVNKSKDNRVFLVIISQGYIAKSIPICDSWDRAKVRWNIFAVRFNRKFDREIDSKGMSNMKVVKPGNILPKFLTIGNHLQHFAKRSLDIPLVTEPERDRDDR